MVTTITEPITHQVVDRARLAWLQQELRNTKDKANTPQVPDPIDNMDRQCAQYYSKISKEKTEIYIKKQTEIYSKYLEMKKSMILCSERLTELSQLQAPYAPEDAKAVVEKHIQDIQNHYDKLFGPGILIIKKEQLQNLNNEFNDDINADKNKDIFYQYTFTLKSDPLPQASCFLLANAVDTAPLPHTHMQDLLRLAESFLNKSEERKIKQEFVDNKQLKDEAQKLSDQIKTAVILMGNHLALQESTMTNSLQHQQQDFQKKEIQAGEGREEKIDEMKIFYHAEACRKKQDYLLFVNDMIKQISTAATALQR